MSAKGGVISARRGRKRSTKRFLRENFLGYVFILPWLFGFLLLTLWPMLQSFYLSFTDYNLFDSPHWVGLDNYIDMFTKDNLFVDSLGRTFKFVIFVVPLKLVFSLIVAMLLNRSLRGMSIYRTMIYLPSLIGSSIAVSVLWRNMFGLDGYINIIMEFLGLPKQAWIANPNLALNTIILLSVWQFGSTMIIFLGGLKQIPNELYESASIDGAGVFRRFWSITLPMLSPTIFFNLILGIIQAFQQFNSAFIVTKGGPAYATYLYALMLYEKAFVHYRMGYASGLAWILLIIIAIFTAANFLLSKYWVFYDDAR